MSAPRSTKSDAVRVALVAFALRAVWVIAVHRPPRGLRDPWIYRRFARGIAAGAGYVSIHGKPTAYYPPGYPYFLGGLQWLANHLGLGASLPLVAGLAQAILGGVAAGATVIAGRELGHRLVGAKFGAGRPDVLDDPEQTPIPRSVGLAGGLVIALWPNLILYSGVMLSETLFIATFAVFLAAVFRLFNRSERPCPLWCGEIVVAALALGVATLVRPQVLLMLPALAVAMALGRWGWRPALGHLGIMAAGVVLLLAPWVIRNASVFHAFVPLSNNGGDNLCVGFHPGASGAFEIPAYCDTGEFYIDGPAAELRRERETTRRARRWATSHLGELPALSVRKLWYTYRSEDDGLRALESYEQDPFLPSRVRDAARVALQVSDLAIMAATLLGAPGVAVAWFRRRGHDVALAALGVMTAASALIPVAFFGDARFKVASAPLFALLAGAGLLIRRWWSVPPIPDRSAEAASTSSSPGETRPEPHVP